MNATSARLIALVCVLSLVVLLLTACSSDEADTDPTPEASTGGPPAVDISAAGTTMTMGVGSSCWNAQGGAPGLCIDKIGIITPQQPLSVARGTTLTIEHPTPGSAIEATVMAYEATGPSSPAGADLAWRPNTNETRLQSMAGPSGVSVTADLPPGRYVLSAFLVVPSGDVGYGVLLEVR